LFGGHGCSGSCSGSCHGGGLFGGHRHGGHGCSGSCSGYCSGSCTGYISCSGGCSGGVIYSSGCAGGMGCAGCAGGVIVAPQAGKPGEKLDLPKEKKPEKKDEVSAPATLVLSLPADAKVTLDGVVTTSTSATRTFVTPELLPAKEFVYVLSAEIVRDGQTLTVKQEVTVRAGEETRVTLGAEKFTALTVAAK
jgi:uncharacterized protein (TIGR03000 family)